MAVTDFTVTRNGKTYSAKLTRVEVDPIGKTMLCGYSYDVETPKGLETRSECLMLDQADAVAAGMTAAYFTALVTVGIQAAKNKWEIS